MSLSTKLNCFFILLIAALAIGGIFYYRSARPRYEPLPIEPRREINLTIIPGWSLRNIADDWTKKGIINNPDELYDLVGRPAYNYKAAGQKAPVIELAGDERWRDLFEDKPGNVSYEGYFFPDTYRVYADASPEDVLEKIFTNLNKKITPEMRDEIERQGKTVYEVITMASVIEREAPSDEEMAMVSDIFWRRFDRNWALQSCATVNYITAKNDPGVSLEDKEIDSLFNTYKYPGLPLGAISNPGLEAIQAAIYPKANSYWYFMSDEDGVTHWAKTLDEHNTNVAKYLR